MHSNKINFGTPIIKTVGILRLFLRLMHMRGTFFLKISLRLLLNAALRLNIISVYPTYQMEVPEWAARFGTRAEVASTGRSADARR